MYCTEFKDVSGIEALFPLSASCTVYSLGTSPLIPPSPGGLGTRLCTVMKLYCYTLSYVFTSSSGEAATHQLASSPGRVKRERCLTWPGDEATNQPVQVACV